MRISFGTKLDMNKGINATNGYGYATNCMLDSLQRLGYHVSPNDSSADVEIWFDQPQHWKFSEGTYKIGYHPWESTQLFTAADKMSGGVDWAEKMNECDEIWTPSPLIADWYTRHAGVRVPVYVYEHGIEHSWEPVKRERSDIVRFLHVGAEATRKGGWDTVKAFRKAFYGRKDVELTLKMIKSSWNGIPRLGQVNYINSKMDFSQLQGLFYSHDFYVYPSWGEGFGLTPLQAIATGMPTITVPGWAPYERFLDPNLNIRHKMTASPWPKIHPGQMMKPRMDDVIDRMRWAVKNYEQASDFAFSTAPKVHSEYDWDELTAKMFGDLEHRIK